MGFYLDIAYANQPDTAKLKYIQIFVIILHCLQSKDEKMMVKFEYLSFILQMFWSEVVLFSICIIPKYEEPII